jgi:hypothetical protein
MFFSPLAPSVDGAAGTDGIPAERIFRPLWHAARFSGGMDGRTMRHRNGSGTRRGSGFVEVLVAAALVLLLVVGTAEMLTLSLKAKRRGDVLAAMTHAVSDRFDGLRARPYQDAALAAGTYAETVRVDPGGCLIAETWEVAEDSDGLKRVRLTVREAGRPGPGTAAVLFIARDLGFRP